MSETVSGRVVRRFSTYSQFYFLQLTWPELSTDSVFPVLVRNLEVPLPKVRPGDLVRIRGRLIDHVSEFYSNRCFEAEHIELVESWDLHRFGVFQYAGPLKRGREAHSMSIQDRSTSLVAAVQCQVDVAERVEEYLRLVYEHDSHFIVQQSTACATSGDDRVILLEAPKGLLSRETRKIADDILSDPILTYVVKRVYVFPDMMTSRGLSVSDAIQALPSSVTESEGPICRIHAYPKNIDLETIGSILLPKKVQFHPKKFNSVLNVVFADGFYYASLVPKEASAGCGEHLTDYSPTDSLSVSKAAAKIREALVRLDKSVPEKANLEGKIAIDIGASPGGWSYFMKKDRACSRVISVDMGLLAQPIPEGVEHWRMKGADAIDRLFEDDVNLNSIHLYTCDMNCDPMDSVTLFMRALPLMAIDSLAVITFKRTERNKERWEKIKSDCITLLRSSERITNLTEVHLIANTPNETTVLLDIA